MSLAASTTPILLSNLAAAPGLHPVPLLIFQHWHSWCIFPSIATMSLGGSISTALDTAVKTAITGGLHFTIAAGNSNVDASTTSPADVTTANTVGAIDSSNAKASFSNYGSVLDIWALGVNVKSAWIGA